MFRVPDGSSSSPLPPPSTPESRKAHNVFSFSNNPSTTPLQPPPTSLTNNSTTPAGQPPTSVLGSSHFNSAIPPPSFQSPLGQRAYRSSPLRPNGSRVFTFDPMQDDDDDDQLEDDREEAAQDDGFDIDSGLDISAIARGLAGRATRLTETDNLILGCENIVQKLDDFVHSGISDDARRQRAFSSAVDDFLLLCQREEGESSKITATHPGDGESPIAKSTYLISLILLLHHPPPLSGPGSSFSTSRLSTHTQPIPEVLLKWLDAHHNPYPNDFRDTLAFRPSPSASERFWEVVQSLSLRGKLQEASELLKHADFRNAVTALDDGAPKPGYQGTQLIYTDRVVGRAVQVLEDCPAVQRGNWNVADEDWRIYRKKVGQALADLKVLAAGGNRTEEDGANRLEMSDVRGNELSMSLISRRAESRVPWAVYENLQYLYAQLLGMRNDIIASSMDWIEAVICTTAWWDGTSSGTSNQNLVTGKISQDRPQKPRPVDFAPQTAYLDQLGISVQLVLSQSRDEALEMNTSDPIQVGLACIFANDFDGLLGILRGWSATISTSLVEIAFLGEWLGVVTQQAKSLMNRFDESDLMVLSYNQAPKKGVKRDDVLTQYASLLFQKGSLESKRTSERAEGWELAISVLSRLDDEARRSKLITSMLDELKLTTAERVEKVVSLCTRIGRQEDAQKIAERFADNLTETSNNYGNALLYYARAHKPDRVKDVLNLLVSFCLVQSVAYPLPPDLDSILEAIISSPKQTLAQLSQVDPDAAQLLSTELSGYATLRKYYELRDEEVNSSIGKKPTLRPLARKKEAASILMTLIASAADSIHGGLFDDSIYSIIPVDGLLVLLGEALVFLNQYPRILTTAQTTTLLRAVEDLSTCPHSISQSARELFTSTLANYHNGGSSGAPSPHGTLKKSLSNLSEGYSLVGSMMLGSRSTLGDGKSVEGSGVLVPMTNKNLKRGWDWRSGLARGVKADEVLRMVRLGLAREVARSWTEAL